MSNVITATMNTSPLVVATANGAVVPASTVSVPAPLPEANTKQDIIDDYNFARQNLYETMKRAMKSFEELTLIATSSQHMRAYEAIAALVKTIGDTNDKLLVLQNNRQALEEQEPEDTKPGVINNYGNTVFVGTTADLQEMIANRRNGS